jgi:hypothetical protein
MRKILKTSVLILVLLFVAIQFVRPLRSNPPVDPDREITAVHPTAPEVTAILQRSCNDCHSNRTVWPWYSNVAPASWLISHDVREGRDALNLSEWARYVPQKQHKLLGEICEQVREGEMPASQYTLLHRQARLTKTDIQSICNWTGQPAEQEAMNEEEDD